MTFIRQGRAFKTTSPAYIFELGPPKKKTFPFIVAIPYLGSHTKVLGRKVHIKVRALEDSIVTRNTFFLVKNSNYTNFFF